MVLIAIKYRRAQRAWNSGGRSDRDASDVDNDQKSTGDRDSN